MTTWTTEGLQPTFRWLAAEANRDLTFIRNRLRGRDGYNVLFDKKLVLTRLYAHLAQQEACRSPIDLAKYLARFAEQPVSAAGARQPERFRLFWTREIARLQSDIAESVVRHVAASA